MSTFGNNSDGYKALPLEEQQTYTRGVGTHKQQDNARQSMVEKHRTKLQKAKEEVGMKRLAELVPKRTEETRREALKRCEWSVERAVVLLEEFEKEHREELKELSKKIKKRKLEVMKETGYDTRTSRSEERTAHKADGGKERRRKSRDEEDGDKRKRKRLNGKKETRRHRDKEPRRRGSAHKDGRGSRRRRNVSDDSSSGMHSDSECSEDRRRRRRRRKYRESRSEYGKYGVLRETDMYTKRPEFILWAMETKSADIESMSKYEEKELFKIYMEDYNTATLPHKKYYDLEHYERSRHGTQKSLENERQYFDDETERKKELEEARRREKEERLRLAYEELKHSDKGQGMKEQELLRQRMSLAYKTGDREEAQRIAEKLKPDQAR